MTPFLGLFTIYGMIFGTWVVLMFFEGCILEWTGPIFHCVLSIQFFAFLVGFLAGLASLVALLLEPIPSRYHPISPPTRIAELPLALLKSFGIAVMFYALRHRELYFPYIAGSFSLWVGVSLLTCAMLLILVNYLSRKNGES